MPSGHAGAAAVAAGFTAPTGVAWPGTCACGTDARDDAGSAAGAGGVFGRKNLLTTMRDRHSIFSTARGHSRSTAKGMLRTHLRHHDRQNDLLVTRNTVRAACCGDRTERGTHLGDGEELARGALLRGVVRWRRGRGRVGRRHCVGHCLWVPRSARASREAEHWGRAARAPVRRGVSPSVASQILCWSRALRRVRSRRPLYHPGRR